MNELEDFTQRLCQACAADPSSPSVVVSWLEDRQEWYAAFHRFQERFGQGKVVVANAVAETLDGALKLMMAKVIALWEAPDAG